MSRVFSCIKELSAIRGNFGWEITRKLIKPFCKHYTTVGWEGIPGFCRLYIRSSNHFLGKGFMEMFNSLFNSVQFANKQKQSIAAPQGFCNLMIYPLKLGTR